MKVRYDCRQVSCPLHSRSGSNPEINSHLDSYDISQRGLAQTRGSVEKDVVEGFVSTLGSSYSYIKIFFYLCLPVEVNKATRSQACVKRRILISRFTRYNTSYL